MLNHSDFIDYGSIGQPMYWAYSTYMYWRLETTQTIFAIIGLVSLLLTVTPVILGCFSYMLPSKLQIYCHSETGSWALVTGASDGIGFCFCEEFLGRGFNVLLHGRNQQKLERIKRELSLRWPRRGIEFVIADASRYDDAYQVVADKVLTLPGKLTVLVNNAGGVTTLPHYPLYTETSHEVIDGTINLNARFTAHLTRALLPVLKENQPSLVINCGSAAGLSGLPYISTYASTKSYVHQLAKCLQAEMIAEGTTGVKFLACIIGNTISAGNKEELPFFTITSRECARGCLDRVGSKAPVVYCHWRHALSSFLPSLMPESVFEKLTAAEMLKRRRKELKAE